MSEGLPEVAPASPAAAAPARGRRWLRRLAWCIGGVLALWALAWLAVPPIVKSQAEQRLSALLGREVRIGRIGFAPWTLTLTVEQFSIASAAGAGAAPQLSIDKLVADADLRSLLRMAPVIETLTIDKPVIRATRLGDGHYDVDDVIARLAPPKDAPPAPGAPARFALYNLKLSDGAFEFDDRPVQRVHRLQDLRIDLPFLSNLTESDIKVTVEPRVAFKLDGAAFDSGVQAKPFAQDRASSVDLRIDGLDLASWLPYLPAALPFKPTKGRLSSQLQFQFALAADGAPRLSLRGKAALADAALIATAAPAVPVVAWKQLSVGLDDVQPLAGKVALGEIALDGAQFDVRRDAQARLNVVPPTTAAAPAPAASAPAAGAWHLSVARLALTQARVDWRDATTRPAAALRVEPLDVQITGLHWPVEAPVPAKLAAQLAPLDAAGATPATLTLEGQGSDRAATAQIDVQGVDLAWLEPYLAGALAARVQGKASAKASVGWQAGDVPSIKADKVEATLDQLKLLDGSASRTPLSATRIALAGTSIDLGAHQLTVGSLAVEKPSLALARDAQGRWNFAQWTPAASGAAAPPARDSAPPEWRVQVGELKVDGAELRLDDQRPAERASGPVQLRGALTASVRDLSWPSGPAAKTQLQLRITSADAAQRAGGPSGRVEWSGSVAPAPLAAKGTLRVERFPVHVFEPYFGSGLNVALLRAEADWRGDIVVTQNGKAWDASAKGNARVNDLRVHERAAAGTRGADELLAWQSLALEGLKFEMRGTAKPKIEVGSAALTDFYSRLVITEQGRFNLRDVAAGPADGASAPAPAASAAPPAPAASSPAAGDGPPVDIRVGGVRLTNGKVDFTDRFIRPNYSAALTELNGSLGAFDSTTPREMATLDLKGRAAGTALLEISGSLNPTAQPLALDIKAKATDLELAPLSPYAGRYAGYAIERGKLSMDVAYKIAPDGKLDAKNQVVLNQLTFGDKVESPDATKLPVLLAVALLKDRNGVIDINLPVSGSINDPQFSVFGIVLKVIGNLLVKALTAPFALLAGGGGEDLSYVAFEAGTPTVAEPGRAALDKVAKSLTDRPALKMTVTGAADPVSEREAIQRAVLDARLLAEQKREALRAGAAADAPLPPLTPAQREALLKRVYDDTKLPDKPRNALGIARSVPAAEMEALLMKATVVSTDSARELALQRGIAVRDALIAKGLPSERLFLAAPKLRASGEEDKEWSPRVQLSLSTQ